VERGFYKDLRASPTQNWVVDLGLTWSGVRVHAILVITHTPYVYMEQGRVDSSTCRLGLGEWCLAAAAYGCPMRNVLCPNLYSPVAARV
jgi:hypothetical protein